MESVWTNLFNTSKHFTLNCEDTRGRRFNLNKTNRTKLPGPGSGAKQVFCDGNDKENKITAPLSLSWYVRRRLPEALQIHRQYQCGYLVAKNAL